MAWPYSLKELSLCFCGPLKGCMCAIDPFLEDEAADIFSWKTSPGLADEISWRIDGWRVKVLCGDCLAQ